MKKFNSSSCFVSYLSGLETEVMFNSAYLQTYSGSTEYEYSIDDWGEYLFLAYDINKLDEELKKELVSKCTDYYTTSDGKEIHFVYNLSFEQREQVMKPFLEGKYSKIDRDYVNKHFKKYVLGENGVDVSANWMILHRSPERIAAWEKRLAVTLPEDAEAESRPEKENEIYGYVTDKPNISLEA